MGAETGAQNAAGQAAVPLSFVVSVPPSLWPLSVMSSVAYSAFVKPCPGGCLSDKDLGKGGT